LLPWSTSSFFELYILWEISLSALVSSGSSGFQIIIPFQPQSEFDHLLIARCTETDCCKVESTAAAEATM
jgi:hypothetical protein